MSVAPKRHISIRLDEAFYNHVKSKPNASRYIQALIKQDYAMEIKQPIVRAVKMELMADEEFFAEIVQRVVNKSRGY